MTNEEAIETLRANYPDVCFGQLREAVDMAINALTAQDDSKELSPTHKALDTISRQAAIEIASGFCHPANIAKELAKLPSAQPERKTGRWVERNPQNSPDCRLIECSECGNAYIVGYNIDYDDWIDGRNFCMKCGADLRGGNNGKST